MNIQISTSNGTTIAELLSDEPVILQLDDALASAIAGTREPKESSYRKRLSHPNFSI